MTGKKGERLAALYLRLHGYTILDTNFHSRFGEIDIIAKKFKTIVFVEVKARGKKAIAAPAYAVDEIKQRKIVKTAQFYACYKDINDEDMRFDVIQIIGDGWRFTIEHIKNAF